MRPEEVAASRAEIRDSARRTWSISAGRDARRGRWVVVRPVHGDNEPFRASADGFRPDAYLPITGEEWALLARIAEGGELFDGEPERVRHEAFRLLDRLVVRAHHLQLMGESEDEDDDE